MLIERNQALQTLAAMASQMATGKGNIALVVGEAGIGKTSLINQFRDAYADEYRWAWGSCDAMFTPRVLGPLYDMLPVLDTRISELLAQSDNRSQLFSAVLNSLQNSERPTIVVCEDFHWADRASLDLLKFLGRRIAFSPVMLVISYRDDEVTEKHPLGQVIGELPSGICKRVELEPLSQSSVTQLAEDANMDGVKLFKMTNGNPFFVTEVINSQQGFDDDVPVSIRDAINARLGHLDTHTRSFLGSFSTMPGTISSKTIIQLFGEQALALVEIGIAGGILAQDKAGYTSFRHELGRLTTLERLNNEERRRCHRAIFDKLNVTDKNELERLVHHASGAHLAFHVLELAPLAAESAAKLGSHSEAAAHLANALKFVDDASPEQAANLYEKWAYEAAFASRIDNEVIDARRYAVKLWQTLQRPEKVGENLRWLSRLHWYRGEAIEADRIADQAIRVLEAVPPSAERAMAYSLRSQLCMLNDQMPESVSWGYQALAIEKQFTNIGVRVHALNNIGTALLFRNQPSGLIQLEQSLKLAKEHGLHEDAARAYVNLSEYTVEFRDFAAAEKLVNQGIAYTTEHDIDTWRIYLVGRLAQLRLEQGKFKLALSISSAIIDDPQLSLLMRLPSLLVLARTMLRVEPKQASEVIHRALQDANATEELQHIVPAQLNMVEWGWLTNDMNIAKLHLKSLLALEHEQRHPWNIGEIQVWAKRFNIPSPMKPSMALPKPFELELQGDYLGAADLWQNLDLPHSAILTLVASNNPNNINQAIALAKEIGATTVLGKIQYLIECHNWSDTHQVNLRSSYKTQSQSHPVGLTKREIEVLKLIIKGLTNKEISAILCRSQRTVEHHISSILSKLDVTSRMAALLRVQNEPWLVE